MLTSTFLGEAVQYLVQGGTNTAAEKWARRLGGVLDMGMIHKL